MFKFYGCQGLKNHEEEVKLGNIPLLGINVDTTYGALLLVNFVREKDAEISQARQLNLNRLSRQTADATEQHKVYTSGAALNRGVIFLTKNPCWSTKIIICGSNMRKKRQQIIEK